MKRIAGVRTYVSVDGGMADNIRPSMYDASYTAEIANRAATDRQSMYGSRAVIANREMS